MEFKYSKTDVMERDIEVTMKVKEFAVLTAILGVIEFARMNTEGSTSDMYTEMYKQLRQILKGEL